MSDVNGWFCWESPSLAYEIGTELGASADGGNAGYVRSVSPDFGEFGAIMQKVDAADYYDRRIRFSGKLRCAGVSDRCGFFLEVFRGMKMIGVDNMSQRAVSGDTDWTHFELVLDVPRLRGGHKFRPASGRERTGLDGRSQFRNSRHRCPFDRRDHSVQLAGVAAKSHI